MNYHLHVDGEQHEFDLKAIKNMAMSGNLTSSTMAWKDGMENWLPVSDIPELAALLTNRSTPPPFPANKSSPPPLPPATPPTAPTHGGGSPLGGKIMAGGDQTFNVTNQHETNVHHYDQTKEMKTCVVSHRNEVVSKGSNCAACNGWALNEFFNQSLGMCNKCAEERARHSEEEYRDAVRAALSDDNLIDQQEASLLEEKAKGLGISPERKVAIEKEIRNIVVGNASSELTSSDKFSLKDAIQNLDLANPEGAFGNLSTLSKSYPENQEIANLYVEVCIHHAPSKGLEFLSISPCFRHDSALKSIFSSILHDMVDDYDAADEQLRHAERVFGDDPLVRTRLLERQLVKYILEIGGLRFAEYCKSSTYPESLDLTSQEGLRGAVDYIDSMKDQFMTPNDGDIGYLFFVHQLLKFQQGERESLLPNPEGEKAASYLKAICDEVREIAEQPEVVDQGLTDIAFQMCVSPKRAQQSIEEANLKNKEQIAAQEVQAKKNRMTPEVRDYLFKYKKRTLKEYELFLDNTNAIASSEYLANRKYGLLTKPDKVFRLALRNPYNYDEEKKLYYTGYFVDHRTYYKEDEILTSFVFRNGKIEDLGKKEYRIYIDSDTKYGKEKNKKRLLAEVDNHLQSNSLGKYSAENPSEKEFRSWRANYMYEKGELTDDMYELICEQINKDL